MNRKLNYLPILFSIIFFIFLTRLTFLLGPYIMSRIDFDSKITLSDLIFMVGGILSFLSIAIVNFSLYFEKKKNKIKKSKSELKLLVNELRLVRIHIVNISKIKIIKFLTTTKIG